MGNLSTFMARDGVDPNKVPKRRVYTGAQIPAVGLGTYGSDRFSAEQISEAVKGAIAVGYRHIDCAAVYGNEHLIGESLQEAIQAGRCAYIMCQIFEGFKIGLSRLILSPLAVPELSCPWG